METGSKSEVGPGYLGGSFERVGAGLETTRPYVWYSGSPGTQNIYQGHFPCCCCYCSTHPSNPQHTLQTTTLYIPHTLSLLTNCQNLPTLHIQTNHKTTMKLTSTILTGFVTVATLIHVAMASAINSVSNAAAAKNTITPREDKKTCNIRQYYCGKDLLESKHWDREDLLLGDMYDAGAAHDVENVLFKCVAEGFNWFHWPDKRKSDDVRFIELCEKGCEIMHKKGEDDYCRW
ncbi:hypothetical protein M011DRAFT_36431 [Sporormia fimetaria CBS 119925]|uniref:Uncharacterized protein n=1 Tax=Sporormia fimetaria CBS 119925 TaxID=1340428 RepID=A0A6A6VDR4_9PLEO|nr:hypothetical protein M011DRAFT_36431 [Sporormia fimetaria CBS 119925]